MPARKAKTLALTVAMVLLLLISAAAEGPEADGTALRNFIEEENNSYKYWPLWPGKGILYRGTSPHGPYLTTYVNQPALESLEKGSGTLQDGSIIVKENYTEERKLASITVMYKRDGYDPGHGNWFYLKYPPQGEIEAEGMVEGCISCHAKAAGNDWLFTPPPEKKN